MKITEALLAEHVVFHNLFDNIEKTVPDLKTIGEIHALSRLLESMLDTHAEAEDTLLIEPLEPSFSQLGHDGNFHAEHEEIDDCLEKTNLATEVEQARELVLKTVLACRKHFDKEERLVFPLAEKQLSEKSQLELGRRWADQRKVFLD